MPSLSARLFVESQVSDAAACKIKSIQVIIFVPREGQIREEPHRAGQDIFSLGGQQDIAVTTVLSDQLSILQDDGISSAEFIAVVVSTRYRPSFCEA